LHLSGVAVVHERHLLEAEVTFLRSALLEALAERDDARLRLAQTQITRLLETEGYVDCDQPRSIG